MSKITVISVKPEFAELIFNGSKKIELRKSAPKVVPGDLIVVYSTFPEMAAIGICKVKKVIKSTPEEIWVNHSSCLGIDWERFCEYYSDREQAVGIVIENTRRFRSKFHLKEIKELLPTFSPPQTFKYYNRSTLMQTIKA